MIAGRYAEFLGMCLCAALQGRIVLGQRVQPPNLSKLPVVSAIEVQFHTNDDDKDADTQLVTDFSCRDSIFASSLVLPTGETQVNDIFIHNYNDDFSDNQTTRWFSIPIQSRVTKAGVHQCFTKIRIDPNGHDTWHFNYWVRLHYSDSTMDEYHYDGHALSEKVRENIFPLK